jgi:pimeloyl-ACP methyl ester carboxylesterase/ketosteroid isomerase-like protein
MFERFTEKARRVIFFARYEASQRGSPIIETEHLLLGLLREDSSLFSRYVPSYRASDLRAALDRQLPRRDPIPDRVEVPLSQECRSALTQAKHEADRLNHRHIGTEHLLLALLREQNSFASRFLLQWGFQIASLENQLAAGPSRPSLSVSATAPPHIRTAVIDDFLTALKNYDAVAVCSFLADDVRFVDAAGRLWIERDQIQKYFEHLFAPYSKRRVVPILDSFHHSERVAFASILFENVTLGTDPATYVHRLSFVLRWQSHREGWTICFLQVTPINPHAPLAARDAAAFTETAISSPDAEFHFHAFVEGPVIAPLVLFLHGFPEFADSCLTILHNVAQAGFRAVAVDQRGYSPLARPSQLADYSVDKLVSDIHAFADEFGRGRFHLVGHDWGAYLAWIFAAKFPDRLLSLTAISTPHPDAFHSAIASDPDQQQRSQYIPFFRMPDHAAEEFFQANDYQSLRAVYQSKLSDSAIDANIRRLSEPGALTAALNWYRNIKDDARIGKVSVPTLYIWSTNDVALGETAALDTEHHIAGPYQFAKLEGKSHWLLSESPAEVTDLLLAHLRTHSQP